MLTILVFVLTIIFSFLFHRKTKRFPTLQAVLLVALAILAAIQNIRFFYLMLIPELGNISFFSIFLNQGNGAINNSSDLKTCLNSVGSEFDRFNLVLGPVAVIWLSIKQIIELLPNKVSLQNSSQPSQSKPQP
ncbi:hypothetical protein [Pseudanabaena sp. BC1403]|uniref:hypothetical protein n=1 Tax=Pseudanabaena sp. BC1403 TaxID=2043171 RepID=UPI000CD979D5|nr:hypothetical protein [Pseudanabaena sp. BC1403]